MIQSLSDPAGMLNLPDLILLLFLIWSVINGARRGFIMSVISLVGRIAVVLAGQDLRTDAGKRGRHPFCGQSFCQPSRTKPRAFRYFGRLADDGH